MRKLLTCLASVLLIYPSALCFPQQSSSAHPKLADILARTSSAIGPAPENFTTPYLVMQVTPIEGQECSVLVATNGMLYSIFGNRDDGWCNHLPALYSLVWGRARHSSVGTFLRQSNVANVSSDYIDLVYSSTAGQKPKIAHYIIASAQAIGPDWGR